MAGMKQMPRLRALVDAFRDEYGSSESWVAEQIGLDRRGLWSWWNTGLTQMPSPFLIHALARTIRQPYRDVLDAALHDFEYLPESTAADAEPPARIKRATGRKL
jgi:hypothetical protein